MLETSIWRNDRSHPSMLRGKTGEKSPSETKIRMVKGRIKTGDFFQNKMKLKSLSASLLNQLRGEEPGQSEAGMQGARGGPLPALASPREP